MPAPNYPLEVSGLGSPAQWTFTTWKRILFAALFRSTPSSHNEPVAHMPGTWAELAEEMIRYLGDHAASRDFGLTADSTERLICREVARAHHASSLRMFLEHLEWNNRDDVPDFFVHLVVVCAAIGEANDGDLNSRMGRQFSQLTEWFAGFDHRLDPVPLNRAKAWSPSHASLGRINDAFEALQLFVTGQRKRGRSIRPLHLPDPRGMVRIGYAKRLTFPNRAEKAQLQKLVATDLLRSHDPTPPLVFLAIDRGQDTLTDRLSLAAADFRQRFNKNALRPVEHFWSLIERVSVTERRRRTDAEQDDGRGWLELAIYDAGESLLPLLIGPADVDFGPECRVAHDEELSAANGAGPKRVLIERLPECEADDAVGLGSEVTKKCAAGPAWKLLSLGTRRAIEDGIVPFQRISRHLGVRVGARQRDLAEMLLVDDRHAPGFQAAGWCPLSEGSGGLRAYRAPAVRQAFPTVEGADVGMLQRSYSPLTIQAVGGVRQDDVWDSRFPPMIVISGSGAEATTITCVDASGGPVTLEPDNNRGHFRIPRTEEENSLRISAAWGEGLEVGLAIKLRPLTAKRSKREVTEREHRLDGFTVSNRDPFDGEHVPWSATPTSDAPASVELLTLTRSARGYFVQGGGLWIPPAPSRAGRWAVIELPERATALVRGFDLPAALPSPLFSAHLPPPTSIHVPARESAPWERWTQRLKITRLRTPTPQTAALEKQSFGPTVAERLVKNLSTKTYLDETGLYGILEETLHSHGHPSDRGLVFALIQALGENAILERWSPRSGFARSPQYFPGVPRLVVTRLADDLCVGTLVGLVSPSRLAEVMHVSSSGDGVDVSLVPSLSPFVPPTVRFWASSPSELSALSKRGGLFETAHLNDADGIQTALEGSFSSFDAATVRQINEGHLTLLATLDISERLLPTMPRAGVPRVEHYLNRKHGVRTYRVGSNSADVEAGMQTNSRTAAFHLARAWEARSSRGAGASQVVLREFGFQISSKTSAGLSIRHQFPVHGWTPHLPMPVARALAVLGSARPGPLLQSDAERIGANRVLDEWPDGVGHCYAYCVGPNADQIISWS